MFRSALQSRLTTLFFAAIKPSLSDRIGKKVELIILNLVRIRRHILKGTEGESMENAGGRTADPMGSDV